MRVSNSEKATETSRFRPTYAHANVGHPSSAESESGLVTPSRRLLSLFATYLHWYIGRHFHAMRMANGGRFPMVAGPMIVYANHASWWDPLAFIVVSRLEYPKALNAR